MKRNRHRGAFAIILALVMTLGLCACGGPGKTDNTDNKEPDPYKVGVFLRFSDEAGTKMRAVINQAVEEINAAGGVNGHAIKLYAYDTEGDSTKAIDVLNRMISTDHVLVAVGPTTSTCALAVIDMAEQYSIPLITPQATNTSITAEYGNEWFFRNSVADVYHAYTLCDYIVEEMGCKNIAIVHETASLGLGQYEDFARRLKDKHGLEPIAVETYNEGDVDFKTQLLAVKDRNPDVIVFAGHEAELSILVSQRLDVGISKDVPVCGFSSMSSADFYGVAGEAAVGCIFSSTFSPVDAREDIQAFVKDYSEACNGNPDHNAAQAYDTVQLLAEILGGVEIGNTDATLSEDREAIRDALAGVNNWSGLTGITTFGAGGGPQDRDGKQVSTIYQLQPDYTWTVLKAPQ